MKRLGTRLLSALLLMVMATGLLSPTVFAVDGETAPTVESVIAQLNAIDSLQEMQDKRYKSPYSRTGKYDINTTDTGVITSHTTARTEYDAYIAQMFAARLAAQQAYNSLTEDQKAQIDASLVSKLSNELPNKFYQTTFDVTPSNDEYSFEVVAGGKGYPGLGYEISNYAVSGENPQTFIIVDTSDGKTSWTPDGLYEQGKSNFDVAYCCDIETITVWGSDYKRVNLEDSGYYGPNAAKHIRAILQNSYPFISMEEMKANLKKGGMDPAFVDSLNRADMISAAQMAVWTYANAGGAAKDGLGYVASLSVLKNSGHTGGTYYTPIHDYSNELWDWFAGQRSFTYDAKAGARVNTLAYYLCNLPGVAAQDDEIVVSNVEVTRAELLPGANGLYEVGMYVHVNGGDADDDLRVYVTAYDEEGNVTGRHNQPLNGEKKIAMNVKAKFGGTIKVEVKGTQHLGKGVYFYQPRNTGVEDGDRKSSQSLVGVAEGETKVNAVKTFEFGNDIEMGLRIYKTAKTTGMPIEGITFNVYAVNGDVGEVPTTDEITKYKTADNLAGSINTDATGYGTLTLEEGLYLVIEEENAKVVEPVAPFYIHVPQVTTVTGGTEGNETSYIEVLNVVSLYPKNEPVTPPEPPIVPPTPDNVVGKFEILKYDQNDKSKVLEGAEFAVYRAATLADETTEIITSGGVQYAVVPVMNGEAQLTLTTDDKGYAISPELPCGTYFLVETKAPSGYNSLEEAVMVTVSSTGAATTTVTEVRIANESGNILPETGGIGTTIFYVLGGLLAVGAGVLLIAKKRMDDDK